MWMSHITHVNESYHACEWVILHIWMSHVTHMNESCHTYEWAMSNKSHSSTLLITSACHLTSAVDSPSPLRGEKRIYPPCIYYFIYIISTVYILFQCFHRVYIIRDDDSRSELVTLHIHWVCDSCVCRVRDSFLCMMYKGLQIRVGDSTCTLSMWLIRM